MTLRNNSETFKVVLQESSTSKLDILHDCEYYNTGYTGSIHLVNSQILITKR